MKKIKLKLIFSFWAFVLVSMVILTKAFFLQVVNREKLISYSKSQFIREVKKYPNRGAILDREGRPLAINIRTYDIVAIPKKGVVNKETFKTLSEIVPALGYKKTFNKVNKRRKYTFLARKLELNKEQIDEIKKLDSIYLEKRDSRVYPNSELYSQSLGIVGVDNNGLEGIEYAFNNKLKGKEIIVKYLKDAKGRPIRFESTLNDHTAKDITLTIDLEIQSILEKSLKESVDKHEALSGGAGVIDAKTGEILAMANYPSFDPNKNRRSANHFRKLSFITDPFEPGSIFKTFTVAAALEENVIREDTSYYCEEGKLKVENHIISEAETHKKPQWYTVNDILKYSSNIGTTKIAFDLTYPKLKKYLDKLHFGKKSYIEIPGESRGITSKKENVTPLSLSNISFGQGIATTGIQMLAAYTAFANDGVMSFPTIIKGKETKKVRVFSKGTVDKIEKMLEAAVETGTGSRARIKHFRIAGKTSTAQRPSKNGGYQGYVPGFIGYPLDVESPFIIFAYVDHPTKKGYYGNQVAAPIFKKIAKFILYRDKVHKDVKLTKKSKTDKVKISYSSQKRKFGKGFVPNFIGLDKRSAKSLAQKYNLRIRAKGFGVVKSQSIKAGIEIGDKKAITLSFKLPKYD
jgi:cell division protein FtsI (penicillin-binding protein 3)